MNTKSIVGFSCKTLVGLAFVLLISILLPINANAHGNHAKPCTGPHSGDAGCGGDPGGEDPPPKKPRPGKPGKPAPSPILSFSATDPVVADGGVTTLVWSSQNADTCTASSGWSGAKNLADSEQVGPITAATTYTLSCTGPGGTAIEMLTVAITTTVSLDWVAPTQNVDGTPLTNLAAYRIYYGSGSRSYDDFLDVTDPTATSYAVDVVSGTYYVAMTAINGDGNESAYSNEVIKTAN
ncbi:MAG: hypothetical protein ACE1ZA_17210 [Pseudomonadales bacterium]